MVRNTFRWRTRRATLRFCFGEKGNGVLSLSPKHRRGLEIGLNVVLSAQQACLEGHNERVIAELHQRRSPSRLFDDCRGCPRNQGLLRNSVEVSGAFLDIRTGLV